MKMFIIGALVVALAALAYIYYKDKNTLSITTGALNPNQSLVLPHIV